MKVSLALSQLSDIIKKYPEDRVPIVGHTDNTGGTEMNQDLSESRAHAVRVLMLEKGIPRDTIAIVGMGESQPVGSNDSSSGRAQNRRVELKITADPESIKQ